MHSNRWGILSVKYRNILKRKTLLLHHVACKPDKKFHEHGTYKDLPRRKRCKKLSQNMVEFMNDKLTEENELTSTKPRGHLLEKWLELNVPLGNVKRYRREQVWVCTHPHYFQLIRHINKKKNVTWCQEKLNQKISSL